MKFPALVFHTCSLAVLATPLRADVIVSELMARGGHELVDEEGERQDWIELYNRGSKEVSLDRFALTDDAEEPLKWKLPARELKAGEFLTVFASGKDRREGDGPLHTNFKLDGDGEYLALVQIEDQKTVSAFDPYFPITGSGESVGFRFEDEGAVDLGEAVIFSTPTPGEINSKAWMSAKETTSGEDLTLDELFPADRVLNVQITLAPEDWDTIRRQTRNIFEVLSEKRKEAPIEGPYTYVEASVTIDGHRFPKVGVRKKGFIGSQSDTRPSLKVKLDQTDKDGGVEGLTNLTFNNNKQDGSLVNQYLGYALFNAAGAPAPRCAFARVTVNGVNLGVYSHVESMRPPLINRSFGTTKGTLYEGTVVDFRDGWEGSFERKFGKDKRGRQMIKKLIEVLDGENESASPIEEIGRLVDLDSFYKFWAVEGILGFWDGYSGNHNNFFVYFNPENGKFHFLPWGADALFDKYSELDPVRDAPLSVKTKGMVAHKLYQDREGRERYGRTLRGLLDEIWDEEQLLAEIDRIEKLLAPHLAPSQSKHARELDQVREFVRTRRGDLEKEIAGGMPLWTRVPEPPPVIPASMAGGLNADSIWQAAKTGDLERIKKHLAAGADLNGKDLFGSAPLALAALTGQTEAVKLLIGRGADVNLGNNENQTPLHGAAFLGRLEIAKVLLDNKADLNARNDRGETPLDAASAEWGPELEGLIKFVAGLLQIEIDLEEVKASRPKITTLLRERGGKTGGELN